MAARIDREELRVLVRQALKDALGEAAAPAAKPVPASGNFIGELRSATARSKPAKVAVPVRSGADLDRFARGILEASADPELKAAILSGALAFAPAGAGERPTPGPAEPARAGKPAQRDGVFQLTSGVLSEARIVEIARTHAKILVGREVVMTPLARDKAREMKVELVRQKP